MRSFSISVLLIAIWFNICSGQSGWYPANDSIPGYSIYDIQFTSSTTGYAIGYNSSLIKTILLKTTNTGTNWSNIYTFNGYCSMDISFVDNLTGYTAVGNNYNNYIYLYKTTNGGANWMYKDSLRGSYNIVGPVTQTRLDFFNQNTGLIRSELSYCYRTTDGGNSWITIPDGGLFMDYTPKLKFVTENRVIMLLTYKIKVSEDGGMTWTNGLGDNTPDYQNYDMYFINSSTGFCASAYYSSSNMCIRKTTNGGHNWAEIFQCDYNSSMCALSQRIYFINESTGYSAANFYGKIYKTTNGGTIWTRQICDTTRMVLSMYFVNENTGFCGSNSGIILKTTTGGVSVRNISGEVPDMFVLRQNYPNPFNPATKIKFSELETGKSRMGNGVIVLKVFDVLGKEVATLVNEKLNPGTYEATFSISGLPGNQITSGVYFYKLTVDGFSETKKMVLIN